MPRELADIQRVAIELSIKERARLVEHLLDILDVDEETTSGELWRRKLSADMLITAQGR